MYQFYVFFSTFYQIKIPRWRGKRCYRKNEIIQVTMAAGMASSPKKRPAIMHGRKGAWDCMAFGK